MVIAHRKGAKDAKFDLFLLSAGRVESRSNGSFLKIVYNPYYATSHYGTIEVEEQS